MRGYVGSQRSDRPWGAVSRAVTTPNHLSTGMAHNLRVALPPGGLGRAHRQRWFRSAPVRSGGGICSPTKSGIAFSRSSGSRWM